MRYPHFLKENEIIELIAPSFGCTIEPYKSLLKSAIQRFENMGYKVIVRDNVYKDDGIGKSTNSLDCGKEINYAFLNNKSSVVYSVGGGELMCEDLNFVDFESISKSNPKWYIGFSDNTNLVYLLPILCDTAAIYGQNFPSYGMSNLHPSLVDNLNVLTGKTNRVHNYKSFEKESLKTEDNPFVPYNDIYNSTLTSYPKQNCTFSGRMIGGCLDCIINLIGTKFDKVSSFIEKYKDDGIIWFLESCDLNMFSYKRALWQMKNASYFKYVKGFIIGRPMHYDESFGSLDRYSAVIESLKEFSVPIILDADIGHLPPMMSIISGAYGNVEYKEGNLNIEYDYK